MRTGGLTNQHVSHSSSSHRRITNLCTSAPANLTASSSSAVPLGLRTSFSIVTPHSHKAPRDCGSKDGDGGGSNEPVNPHRPSCASLLVTFSFNSGDSVWATLGGMSDGGGRIGICVQMRVCSTSKGTWVRVRMRRSDGTSFLT